MCNEIIWFLMLCSCTRVDTNNFSNQYICIVFITGCETTVHRTVH
ncbi:hypothetical protein GLYMA_19G248850v4 [Glycine max]|nr:hypothetical protein GLYMA_19G248850v4 [Glycine max]KAH1079464.1 hypothetical protein GYH30_054153 [Glycine max]